jgi:hypothetical protein
MVMLVRVVIVAGWLQGRGTLTGASRVRQPQPASAGSVPSHRNGGSSRSPPAELSLEDTRSAAAGDDPRQNPVCRRPFCRVAAGRVDRVIGNQTGRWARRAGARGATRASGSADARCWRYRETPVGHPSPAFAAGVRRQSAVDYRVNRRNCATIWATGIGRGPAVRRPSIIFGPIRRAEAGRITVSAGAADVRSR